PLKISDNSTRIAGRENIFGNIARHDAAGTDHSARSNTDAGQDQRTAAHPHVGADLDRLAVLLLSAPGRVERMQRSEDLHARTEQRVVADAHFAYVEHDAVEVEEHPRAELDVRAVVAI